jgi:hypothetical protein
MPTNDRVSGWTMARTRRIDARGCAQRFCLDAGRHQATGAEEGQRRKTHATEASEKLDTAASYNADAAAG